MQSVEEMMHPLMHRAEQHQKCHSVSGFFKPTVSMKTTLYCCSVGECPPEEDILILRLLNIMQEFDVLKDNKTSISPRCDFFPPFPNNNY